MNSELHAAITNTILQETWVTWERATPVVAGSGLAADAILTMPEMQAIRKVIWQLCEQSDWNMSSSKMLSFLGLPESIIDWVLDEETRRG